MKVHSFKTLLFVMCSLTLVFSSCKKDDVEPTTPVTPTTPSTPTITTPFTAKIDGVEFVETELIGTVSAWSSTLEIKASRNNGAEYVRLKMPATITAGTYDFADPDAGFRAAYYNDGNSIYGAPTGTGTLVIVSNSGSEIKGTFNFNASQYSFSTGNASYAITEGQFSVTY